MAEEHVYELPTIETNADYVNTNIYTTPTKPKTRQSPCNKNRIIQAVGVCMVVVSLMVATVAITVTFTANPQSDMNVTEIMKEMMIIKRDLTSTRALLTVTRGELAETRRNLSTFASRADLAKLQDYLNTTDMDLSLQLATTQATLENVLKKTLSADPIGTFSGSLYISGSIQTYTKNQNIIFSKIIYNSGSYNSNTGIFTAPVTALYYIHLDIGSCGPGYNMMSVRVRKGSTLLGYVGVGYDIPATSFERGSGTMIAEVQKGEKIILDAYSKSGAAYCLYGFYDTGYSYLSIFPIDGTYTKLLV